MTKSNYRILIINAGKTDDDQVKQLSEVTEKTLYERYGLSSFNVCQYAIKRIMEFPFTVKNFINMAKNYGSIKLQG